MEPSLREQFRRIDFQELVQRQYEWAIGLELKTWAKQIGPATWEIARVYDNETRRFTDAYLVLELTHGYPIFVVKHGNHTICQGSSPTKAMQGYHRLANLACMKSFSERGLD